VLIKTEGLVIKTVKFQETSLIVKIFTETHGLLSFMVNGVRSSKAQNKAALFQPLTFLDLVVYYRDNKNLLRLKEFKNAFIYQSLPFDIVKSSVAMLLLEVIEQSIKEEETNEDLYFFLKEKFKELDAAENASPNFILHFFANFMTLTGIQPFGIFSTNTPYFNLREGSFLEKELHHEYSLNQENSELFSKLLQNENIVLSKVKRKEMLQIMLKYYQIHIDGFKELRSLKIFEELF